LQQLVRLDGSGQCLDARPGPGAPGIDGGGNQLGQADLGGDDGVNGGGLSRDDLGEKHLDRRAAVVIVFPLR